MFRLQELRCLRFVCLLALSLAVLLGPRTAAGQARYSVGAKVEAGPGFAHPATILKDGGSSYFVHFNDNYAPDGWQPPYMIRAATSQKRAGTAATAAPATSAAQSGFGVGERVEAGGAFAHPATILKGGGASYFVHYDDNFAPDGWLPVYEIRSGGTQKRADAAAASGPRPGKYLIYGYAGTFGAYNGYFMLNAGGSYAVFLPGGKPAGSGIYEFDRVTTTVKWKSGPFADPAWDGTQKFEVSREGKTHIIRLKARTIGTSSSDSQD